MSNRESRPNKISWRYVLIFYLLAVALWQALYSFHLFPKFLFPSPLQVGARLVELVGDGLLWPSVSATLGRMLMGFFLSALLGIVVGVFMGMNSIVSQSLKSLFLGLQTLPTAAWVPLSLIFFGLKDSGIYFVIVMSSMPAVAISTADGIARIPSILLQTARTLGTPKLAMAWEVVIPAALPSIITGIKLGWTLGWHGAVSAELIKSSIGLGFLLQMGRELSDSAQVIAIMIVTVILGLLVDRFIFGAIEKGITRRWGLERA